MPLRALIDLAADTVGFRQLRDDLDAGPVAPLQLMRAARPLIAAALNARMAVPLVYVAGSVEQSRVAYDAFRALAGPDAVLRFAEPNTAFFDSVPPVREVITQRSAVLAALASQGGRAPLIVASPRALMQPLAARRDYAAGARLILRDQVVQLEALLKHWLAIGYEPETVVEHVGAFSRRGGILDVWSPALALPARIELFGDQVDSIRLFDPSTQRSGQSIDRLMLAPLDAPQGGPGARQALPAYLPAGGLLVIDDEGELAAQWRELEARAERERESMAAGPDARPYLAWDEFAASARASRRIILGQADEEHTLSRHPIAAEYTPPPHFGGQLAPLLQHLGEEIAGHPDRPARRVIVVSRQSARLADLWTQGRAHASPGLAEALDGSIEHALTFVTGALPGGYVITSVPRSAATPAVERLDTAILSDAEIFGYLRPEPASYQRARRAAPERAFADWQPGDAVVHEDYGIGMFRGLVKLTVPASPGAVNRGESEAPAEREYLLIEYVDANRLYVPLHQLDRVSRYVGNDDARPQLSRLGSGEWETSRRKAKGAVVEVAREMLRLYAERELAEGYAFGADTAWQHELEASFPFVETEDQLKAIEAVKADLQRKRPMDRLVCGDVGFGKTEVALRAAFKAVQEGRQVAVLVPTTVLAQQHWTTFSRRLASYPIKVEMLSRFRTAAEKAQVREKLRLGQVDIVIGTHGLAAESTAFKDLGLVIIDEEQRFGITDKERLKKLRASVHVLTLTATPIPRTLYLGLTGIRDISRIETPPVDRLPIISYVGPADDTVIQQAIRRELDRDGQVFIVHNRIQTLGMLSERVRKLVPEASVAIAHGQMEDRKLAGVMSAFADGRSQILLCTNIIESGLDIPNANTIIIDRADMFGLGELYQLRGRVGRSSMQAYAYFLHDKRARLTEEARDRLETMREARGIGAGYMIAMRDLELRGAGDMLGPKQSGQVASVGLDLYTRLLGREVATLRALRDGTALPPPEARPLTIDLPLAVGLPEGYIPDPTLRVQMYRRVASLDSEARIQAFEEELIDRFGRLPQPAINLTFQARMKLLAQKFGAQSITSEGNRFTIRADSIEALPAASLRHQLGEDGLVGRKQVSFLRSGTPDQWKKRLMDVVAWMAAQYTKE